MRLKIYLADMGAKEAPTEIVGTVAEQDTRQEMPTQYEPINDKKYRG